MAIDLLSIGRADVGIEVLLAECGEIVRASRR